jgi:hypothetical protein|tara:strand:- start:15 stop:434 length:420 start_codon:yes stop_codon:yes gene_type:complete
MSTDQKKHLLEEILFEINRTPKPHPDQFAQLSNLEKEELANARVKIVFHHFNALFLIGENPPPPNVKKLSHKAGVAPDTIKKAEIRGLRRMANALRSEKIEDPSGNITQNAFKENSDTFEDWMRELDRSSLNGGYEWQN